MAVLAYNGQGNSGKSERAVKALGLLPTLNRAIAHDQKKVSSLSRIRIWSKMHSPPAPPFPAALLANPPPFVIRL